MTPRGTPLGRALADAKRGNSTSLKIAPPAAGPFHSAEVQLLLTDPVFDRREVCFGGELDSTGQFEVQVACRGWSAGHVKSRPKNLIAESNLAMAA